MHIIDLGIRDNSNLYILCSKFCSKRLSFIGTDWYEIGERQAQAMLQSLNGRKGKVVMLGLIEQSIDQRAFEGFRSIAVKAGRFRRPRIPQLMS